MFTKILGCLIVIGCCCKIGFDEAFRFTCRVKEIRDIQASLICMKNSISFLNQPMYPTLLSCAENKSENVTVFFKSVAKAIKESNTNVKDAWFETVDNVQFCLKNDEKDFLKSIGSFLGKGDAVNQLENIDLSIEKLKIFENNATDDEKKYSKLFKSAGISIGLFLAIFFI